MAVTLVIGSPRKYYGLSTDVKPSTGLPAGCSFYETDTGNIYEFDGLTWVEYTLGSASITNPLPIIGTGRKILGVQNGADLTATWANGALVNTYVPVYLPVPATLYENNQISVYNPSTTVPLLAQLCSIADALGGANPALALGASFSVPAAVTYGALTVAGVVQPVFDLSNVGTAYKSLAKACGTTSASATVTCIDTSGLAAGDIITGSGIPDNSIILTITANTSFTISNNATATASPTLTALACGAALLLWNTVAVGASAGFAAKIRMRSA